MICVGGTMAIIASPYYICLCSSGRAPCRRVQACQRSKRGGERARQVGCDCCRRHGFLHGDWPVRAAETPPPCQELMGLAPCKIGGRTVSHSLLGTHEQVAHERRQPDGLAPPHRTSKCLPVRVAVALWLNPVSLRIIGHADQPSII
jgi:hypothetical protein